jgi:hypothetical protein
MRFLLIPILLTSSVLSDTYIRNSVISNSVIGDNFSSIKEYSSTLSTKNIIPKGKFSKIEIKFPAKLTITKSSFSNIKLKMDKNFIDNIFFKVYNDTLHIYTDSSISTRLKTEIVINAKFLEMLKVGGTTNAYIKGFNVSSFKLLVSGTAKVTFLSGSINRLSLQSSGTSKINLDKIYVNQATIESRGTSKTIINVSEKLNVNLSGIAKVQYFGNPRIQKKTKGLGKLIKMN